MRMRVARTHHSAAILEQLHIVDIVSLAEFDILLRPRIHNCANLFHRHPRQSEIVS
jgi:hypothetical protein